LWVQYLKQLKHLCLDKIGFNALWENSCEPFLRDVMVDKCPNIYPKLAYGRPLSEMEPFSIPLDIEST
jgi:acetolactate synthase-1/2/3 large subunit